MAGRARSIESQLSDLAKTLRALPPEISGKRGGPLRQALRAVAHSLRQDVQAATPVRTGSMRTGIIVRADPNPKQLGGASERFIVSYRSGKYGRMSYYAGFVHWGTAAGKQGPNRANPWAKRVFDQRASGLTEEFRGHLTKRIGTAVRRAKRGAY